MKLSWNSNTGQVSEKTVTQGGRELGGQNIQITSCWSFKEKFHSSLTSE